MFKITIKETKEVKKTLRKEWVQTGTKEVERDNEFVREGEPRTRLEPVFNYTPEVETTVTEEREVYTQEVDKMSLADVIKAINGI